MEIALLMLCYVELGCIFQIKFFLLSVGNHQKIQTPVLDKSPPPAATIPEKVTVVKVTFDLGSLFKYVKQ